MLFHGFSWPSPSEFYVYNTKRSQNPLRKVVIVAGIATIFPQLHPLGASSEVQCLLQHHKMMAQ
jgi:hypothetical protein